MKLFSNKVPFSKNPTISGWYGVIRVVDDGNGRVDVWSDALYWKRKSWKETQGNRPVRASVYFAEHRSVKAFYTKQEAMNWAENHLS